jgi:hypothetical protein
MIKKPGDSHIFLEFLTAPVDNEWMPLKSGYRLIILFNGILHKA